MQTGELERLKEFGITKDMLQEQADAMGIVFQNNKGQITSYENLNTALFALMEDRYKGAMEIQSKTFKGMVSNAQDMIGNIGETVGEPIFNAFKDSLENILELGQNLLDSGQIEKWAENVANGIENLIGFVETVGNAFDWMKENIDVLTPVAISIGVAIAAVMTPAIIAWTTATTAAAIAQWALIAPILATVAPIIAVGAVIGGLIYVWKTYGDSIKTYVSEAWHNVQTTFDNMISFVSGINLWEIGANMIRGLVDGMLSMLDSAMETAKNIGSGIANTLKNFFQINSPSKLMFSYGGYIGQGLDLGMQSAENNVKNTAESMGQSTETGLAGSVTNIANADNVASGLEKLGNFTRGVGDAFGWAKQNADALAPILGAIGISIFTLVIPSIVAWTYATVAQAAAQWALIAPMLATVAPILAVGAVIGGLIWIWKNYGDAIKTYVTQAWVNIQTQFNQIKTFLSGINLFEIGANIIRGLVNGMASMLGKAKEIASNIGNNIANTFKSFFGIQSPSKLMFEYGRYIGQGLDLGMQSAENNVKNTAESMGQSAETGLAGSVTNIANGVAEKFKNFFGIASPSKLMFEYDGYIGEGLDLGMQSKTQNLEATGQTMAKATEGEFVNSTSSTSNSFAPSINITVNGNGGGARETASSVRKEVESALSAYEKKMMLRWGTV